MINTAQIERQQLAGEKTVLAHALRRLDGERTGDVEGIAFHTDAHIDSFSSSPW